MNDRSYWWAQTVTELLSTRYWSFYPLVHDDGKTLHEFWSKIMIGFSCSWRPIFASLRSSSWTSCRWPGSATASSPASTLSASAPRFPSPVLWRPPSAAFWPTLPAAWPPTMPWTKRRGVTPNDGAICSSALLSKSYCCPTWRSVCRPFFRPGTWPSLAVFPWRTCRRAALGSLTWGPFWGRWPTCCGRWKRRKQRWFDPARPVIR